MGRTVKRLSGLEIDEVSLVNRPANQHGIVAIAKAMEDSMPIYDNQGDEVGMDELEHGDVVYDDAGTELVFVEDGADENEYEDELVGKARMPGVIATTSRGSRTRARVSGRVRGTGRRASAQGREAGERIAMHGRTANTRAGMTARSIPGQASEMGARAQARGYQFGEAARGHANNAATAAGMQYRAIPENGRRAIKYGAGGAALVGAGGLGYASKSLGDEVMESLSKALTDDDRSEVIANAMDYMESVAKSHDQLQDMVDSLLEDRETDGYVQLAKSYELPADPEEIAGLLFRASQYLPEGDMATLDRMFSSVSDIAKSGYEEIGYAGGYESDALAQVYAAAGEVVSKSGAQMTQEQAVTALFDANPAAYDMYEAEQR